MKFDDKFCQANKNAECGNAALTKVAKLIVMKGGFRK